MAITNRHMADDLPGRDTLEAAHLPMGALLALAMAGFITILTEALPAGLLPQISGDLGISQSLVGQLVTINAVGSFVAAIPLTAATRGWRRKPLLISAIAGFAVANSVTALSTDYALTLVARFFAGVSAGLLWALLAGYAARMVPEHLKGRAIAVAMVGTPLALSIGIPAGTFVGTLLGWRLTFGAMSIATLMLILWVALKIPDFAGQSPEQRLPLFKVLAIPGLKSVLFVTLAFVLAHNILYTYIAAYLALSGMENHVDLALLAFGVAALAGIWLTAAFIDRWLRELVLISTVAFALTAKVLAISSNAPTLVMAGMIAWGLAFGGAATLFQTASAKTAGEAADVAQSMIVTAWNVAIAGGGSIGGLLLRDLGAASLPWSPLVLLVAAALVAANARTGGFPSTRH